MRTERPCRILRAAAADALIETLTRSNVYAGEVALNDPAILWHEVDFPGKAGTVFAYLARPSAVGRFPGVIVNHANQGLNDYTRDVAHRLAKRVYVALAVDFLSRSGGTKKANPKGQGLGNIIYPGAQHGIHSDNNPERYHPEAAKEAWGRTLDFFRQQRKD